MTGKPQLVPGSLLLGSALDLRADMLGALERARRDHGDTVRFRLGPPRTGRELWVVFHPDGAQRVLAGNSANYRKDNVFYSEVRDAVGDGLLTSQDDDWQRQKRFLQPLFTHRRVAGYADTLAAPIEDLIRRWRTEPATVRDMDDAMMRLAMRIVCRVLFGDDIEHAIPVVQRWVGPLGEAVRRRANSPVRLSRRWPTPMNRRLARGQGELFAVCDRIINDRRARNAGGQDLLGLLIDARDSGTAMTDDEVRDQVLVFLLAGHETTSTALTFALYLLSRHPDVQERVRAEVDDIGGVPDAEQAATLTYTTMVLKETMRMFPSAPLIGRRSVADDEIGGYVFPGGTDVILVPWVTHRHPAFWESPERFDPLRFTPELEKARHRYAWFPFGGGPRACIGQHLSMLESTMALAALVQNFTFTASGDEPKYTSHITLRPTTPVTVLVEPRATRRHAVPDGMAGRSA
ncbi:MAG TPA: cytochrome P450 [Actinoplanes sp.]